MMYLAFIVMVLVTMALTALYLICWVGSVADDSHTTRVKVAVVRDVLLAFTIMSLITCFKLWTLV